jgi:2-polyprenyl-3-methyl-5-hydroxy-6-metoxy-1,4-benzoquinol methylase
MENNTHSFGYKFSYHLLKLLSNNKNLKTNEQISEIVEAIGYNDIGVSSLFLKTIEKHFSLRYKDLTFIDIGCGEGDLVIMLAKMGAKKAVGIDLDAERIDAARRNADAKGVGHIARFECIDFNEYRPAELFDVAFSLDAFEHIVDRLDCLKKINNCLTTGGVLATIFGPLWGSPYGAHMYGFSGIPWIQFLFPEEVVLRVRKEVFRPDEDAKRYEDIRGHLARVTVKKFKDDAIKAGFTIQQTRLNPYKDEGKYKLINAFVNAVPLLHEPGAHKLLAVLRKNG